MSSDEARRYYYTGDGRDPIARLLQSHREGAADRPNEPDEALLTE